MHRVWSGDGWHREDEVDRGMPIIFSEREWRRRAWRYVHKYSLIGAVYLIGIILLPLAEFLPARVVPGVLSLAGTFTGLYLLCIPFMGGLRLLRGAPVPGLYERGIELPRGRFVPYEDLVSVWRSRYYLNIYVGHGMKRLGMDPGLYGREGLAHLKAMETARRVSGRAVAPPKLVVYGGER